MVYEWKYGTPSLCESERNAKTHLKIHGQTECTYPQLKILQFYKVTLVIQIT